MEAILARALQLLVALGGAYIVALWFALVVWTFQDIQRRSRSVIAQIFSTLVVVLFWLPGVLIYLILRPKDTLDETFQRSLEEEYLLQDLEELPLCPNCQHYVQEDYAFCPHCRTELRQPCVACNHLIDLRWEICPFCGAEQYGEEREPELQPGTWDMPEPAGMGRLVSQARERISTRWSRLPAESSLTPEISTSVSGSREYVHERLSPLDDPAGTGWSRGSNRSTTDGNGTSAHVPPWETTLEEEPEQPLEQTDELPKVGTPPQS